MKLPLQTLLVLWIICTTNGAPYSKYGRTCKDIGCLPREVCIMAYESCSFNQQENVSCGRYPTCKKNSDAQSTQQSSGPSYPSRTTSDPNASVWNFPATTKYTTQRTTTTTTTRRPWTTKSPFYNPVNPAYGGGGGYYGNRYGDDTTFGGFSRPTTRYTTKRPSSSSGSSFDSFFSGFSDLLSGDVGKLINSFGSRGGSSGGGGFGSFFGGGDTRPLIENKNYRGGLFSENTNTGSTNNNYNAYPVTRYGQASPSTSRPASSASHGSYGWKMS